jgi:hypothetical protein
MGPMMTHHNQPRQRPENTSRQLSTLERIMGKSSASDSSDNNAGVRKKEKKKGRKEERNIAGLVVLLLLWRAKKRISECLFILVILIDCIPLTSFFYFRSLLLFTIPPSFAVRFSSPIKVPAIKGIAAAATAVQGPAAAAAAAAVPGDATATPTTV